MIYIRYIQNIIYISIFFIIICFFWKLEPISQGISHGILLPFNIEKSNFKIKKKNIDIKIYFVYPKKKHYEKIGLIRTIIYYKKKKENFKKQLIKNEIANLNLAKSLAFQNGANAIVITMLGSNIAHNNDINNAILNAIAINIK